MNQILEIIPNFIFKPDQLIALELLSFLLSF